MLKQTLGAALVAAGLVGPAGQAGASSTEDNATTPPNRSVYRINGWVDGSVMAVAGLGALLPWAFANKLIHPKCPCDPSTVNAFDRAAIRNSSALAGSVSDLTVLLAFAGPAIADTIVLGFSRELLEDAVVFSEAIAVSGALVTLAKYTTQRPLPVVYAGRAPELIDSPSGYRSFYSGHTTLGFTMLTTFAWTYQARYGAAVWPWALVAVGGSSIAFERVAAGRHFYSDVLVGAVAGLAVGTAIPLLHARNWGLSLGGSVSDQHFVLTLNGRL